MSAHQDHPHLDKVKTHFISGEPGTTGREPFEDSIKASINQGLHGQGVTGDHNSSGLGQGQGITGGHSSGLDTGSSHTHGTGAGLTGSSGTGLTGSSGAYTGSGLTGRDGDYSTGAGTASHQQHNANTSAAGAGAVGIAGHGLTGLSHPHNDGTGVGTGTGHIGSSPSHTDESKGGIVEKIKQVLPGGHSSSDTTSHSSAHNTSTTHSTTGTGTGAYPASGHGTGENRGIVDKINDTLPGTPAKTAQHYGTSHNSSTHGDHTVGAGGVGNEYAAGKHGTSGAGAGLAGAGVGAGVASAAHHHSSTSDHHSSGLGGGGLTGATGGHREHGDRVGGLGQDSSRYEGDLSSGPRTSGAAGTERFDTHHTGSAAGVGSGLNRHDDGVHQDTSQRAPGEKSGGIGGILGTSDKDFTGRERQGKGAYADTDGLYQLNSTGPAGNTALTGREGDLSKNPVAQSSSTTGATSATHGTTPAHGTHAAGTTGEHAEKEGLLAKVKHALGA